MDPASSRPIDLERLDPRTLEPVVKLALIVGVLAFTWALLATLPGVHATLFDTGVTYGALLGGAVTLAIVAAMVALAKRVAPVVTDVVVGPSELVDDLADIATYLVLFLAVLVAHGGLAAMAVPLLAGVDLAWGYDPLFLVLALIPTILVAVRMYGNVDDVAAIVAADIAGDERSDRSDERTEPRSAS